MLNNIYKKYIKRTLDLSLCTGAAIVLSPIYIVSAAAIKASSKGPVLYVSKRAGIDKKPFDFYKFRSMHITNKDKGMFIADGDRLFKVGKIMRRTKIDELPQLLNVIKGDMSIVGPRPMVADNVEQIYGGKYSDIVKVKPGLTSPASLFDYIIGDQYTDDELYKKEVLPIKQEMELYYVHNISFRYDAEIVLRTIKTILQIICKSDSLEMPKEYYEIKGNVDSMLSIGVNE